MRIVNNAILKPQISAGDIATLCSIHPRSEGVTSRMNGCKIYGSNTSATADLVEIGEITGLIDNQWNDYALTADIYYEFLVIKHPANYCEMKEFKFFAGATDLAHVALFSSAPYSAGFEKEKARDGDLGTVFTSADVSNGYIAIQI